MHPLIILMMKGGCLMDSLRSMNNAMSYIEEHLTEDIDYSKIAKIAYCSEYHFKRMFSFLSGVSLSDYIRRRRLTLAVLDLKDRDLRIIDVAVKYGYNSADSFSRAFHSLHGILPSEARSENTQLKAYPRMTFQLSIKGGCEMNYRIVEKELFKLVGFKKRVPVIFEGVNPEIEKVFPNIFTKTAIAIIKSYPTAMDISKATPEKLTKIFRHIKGNSFNLEKAKYLIELAKSSIYTGRANESRTLMIKTNIKILELYIQDVIL